jgi:glycerol-3-phosphate dehydrogenase
LAHLYGTRLSHILDDAETLNDLGTVFDNDLTLAEVKYLVHQEWARSAEDILWRRTKLGLRTSPLAVNNLQNAVSQLLREN